MSIQLTASEELEALALAEQYLYSGSYTRDGAVDAAIKKVIARRFSKQAKINAMNARPPKFSIDWKLPALQKHLHCNKVIRRSSKNQFFIGLYCKDHNKLIQWINYDQKSYIVANMKNVTDET